MYMYNITRTWSAAAAADLRQISDTLRRDTVVDVAMDPCVMIQDLERMKQDIEQLQGALFNQSNTAAGAAPPEDLERRDPSRTRSQRKRECIDAAAAGDLTRLKRAHENGPRGAHGTRPWDMLTFNAAVKGGHLECMKYLREKGCPWDENPRTLARGPCAVAARGGHLECLKYLYENGCPWGWHTCRAAAESGQLECLKYLHEKGCAWDRRACNAAVEGGHLECLKYLRENGCRVSADACSEAAQRGHLECLKYLHENGGRAGDDIVCQVAAGNGRLECLKYAHENGCPWDKWTCEAAASNDHLECLKYAHENECPWDKWTCEAAVRDGHLECLKYAHENGCPWDEDTCQAAAFWGHLECLKYLHENECPWNSSTCLAAANGGHLECLKYAHENGCPMFGDDVRAEIMRRQLDGAMRSYLDSIRPRCPIESVMATLDEVKELIPDGKYIKMSNELMHAHREKKRRRPNQ